MIDLLKDHYSNLNFLRRNIFLDVNGTKYENLIASGIVAKANLEEVQYSNLMRLLYLYKYGGLYLDLDIVSLTRIPIEIPKNFAGIQGKRMNNAFIKMEKGHCFLASLIQELVR